MVNQFDSSVALFDVTLQVELLKIKLKGSFDEFFVLVTQINFHLNFSVKNLVLTSSFVIFFFLYCSKKTFW